MSAEENSYTSVLLPAANITLFTEDANTKKVFEAMAEDWRFARVDLTAKEGDVAKAINYYSEYESPDLIILQSDKIDDEFLQQLEDLAGKCSEDTTAIVIGPVNDVNLYRQLIGMGVSDYLVKPVKIEQLSNDIAATLINKKGSSDSRIIALMGAKGGVGVTVLSEALAWGVSEHLGQKTFLLDAAGGWSTLSVGMDFDPSTTLAEAVRAATEHNEDSLTRMIHKASDKLSVLGSGGDVMLEDNVTPSHYEELLDYLMIKYPVVIVDLSSSNAALKQTVLKKAHEIILVTVPTLPAVRASRTLLQEIKQLRGDDDNDVDLVVNMRGIAAKHEVPGTQIENGLERKISEEIPFDPALFVKTESDALKLYDTKAGLDIMHKIMPLVETIIERVTPEGRLPDGKNKTSDILGGFMAKLKSKG